MKKVLLIVCALIPFLSIAQGLSGSYVVGASQPFPFNTLTNAVSRINAVGVTGPVTFLLDNSDYSAGETFPIRFLQYSGSSAVNTLRIKPNVGKTVTITANPSGTGYTGVPSTLLFDGADNIIIDGSNSNGGTARHLTITNNDNISYLARTAIWIASNGSNGATNIRIANSKIRMVNRNQEQLLFSGIYSGSNSIGTNNTLNMAVSTAPNSQTFLTNNEFLNVRQGIYINSNTNAPQQSNDIQINANVLGSTNDAEKPSLPISLTGVNGFSINANNLIGILNNSYSNMSLSGITVENGSNYEIKRNVINDVRLTTNAIVGYGLLIKGNDSNGVISENKISNVKNTGYGMMRAFGIEVNSAIPSGMLLSNNFLSDIASNGTTTNTAHGIYVGSARNIRIYHNTVSMAASQTGASAALYVNSGSEFDVRNNIFLNSSHSGTKYAVYSAVNAAAYNNINFNDYFSQPIGYLSGDQATLANWKSATGKDANSVTISPVFTSATDLHLPAASNAALDNLGTAIAEVQTDIDGTLRSTTQPDMGADEFTVAPVLASEPTISATAVTFTNVSFSGFTINWVNGNGARRIVLLKSVSAVNGLPVDGISYTANSIFGSGTQIGSGNFVVYSGTGSSVVVSGLAAGTNYHVAVLEFNGTAGIENYLTSNPALGNRTTLNAPLGWQIANLNAINTITFDNTVAGVNVAAFEGTGISPVPASGQLNSNSWAVSGFNEGTTTFGAINESPEIGRGNSSGGVSVTGIYAFKIQPANTALGIQPGGGDFTPGSLSLRFQNQTGAPITSLSVGYKVYIYNDQAASSKLTFSHSDNNTSYNTIPSIDVITTGNADPAPGWKASYRVITITGLNIGANNYYYLRWTGETISGDTTFDEFALDDIMLVANPTTIFASFDGTADDFLVYGNTSLSGNTTISKNLTIGSGKINIGSNNLTLSGQVTNTVTGGLKGSSTSNITVNGNGSPILSFDQTTPGTTNVLNNLTLSFSDAKTVTLQNPLLINGTLSVGLDQILNMGTIPVAGNLATITINGTLRTQNTTPSALPSGKIWGGTGTVLYDAPVLSQQIAVGTYNNLTIASPAGAIANGAITVNGILDLPRANPSATSGSLAMGSHVITMGGDATNTGIGEVTGVTARNTIVPNTLYTFGHPNISILFPNVGTLPSSMSLKTTIGAAPSWKPGAVKRFYDFIQTGGVNTKAVIKSYYLDSEVNNNNENKLVDFAHIFASGTTLEQGRSNYNVIENWIELTNVNVGLYFSSNFGAVNLTFGNSTAGFLTWNGAISDSWTTAANWTPNATPSDDTAVIIPNATTTPNDPTLNPATLLGFLTIEQGGILNAPANSQFTINGDSGAWINNGVYNPGTGTSRVIFTNPDATMAGTTNINNLTINSGAGVRILTGNVLRIAGTFSNLGSFSAGAIDNTVVYNGTNQSVVLPTGSLAAYHNLIINGTGAIFPSSLNVAGNLTLNQPVSFIGKSLTMNGNEPQTIAGNVAPLLNNLVINNVGGGVTLSTDVTVNGTLTLTSGNLTIGDNNLTLGTTPVAGMFGVANMIVADGAGMVRRPFTAADTYFFPIGERTSNPAYSPISVAVTAGSFSNAFVGVSVVDAIHPDNHSTQNYISRYWKLTQTGITGAIANINANYITPELLAPASSMAAALLTGSFDVQTNPWVRYQTLSGLTATANNAPLAMNEMIYFTGIKGGDFTTQISGSGTFCQDEMVTLSAETTGGDAPYLYSWSDTLGTEATAVPATDVAATKSYTVTVKDANGITATGSAIVTTTPKAQTGNLSGDQNVCLGYLPDAMTLSGYTGTILYWQRADNPDFSNAENINVTSATLTGADAGEVSADTYFRVAIANGACPVVYSDPLTILVRSTVWNGSSWSNGVPDSTTSAVITGNYSLSETINACTLTVVNGAVVTIPTGFDINLNGALTVYQSTVTLQNNSNLKQLSDEANIGAINVKRTSAPLFRLDYTMWGSPVSGSQTLKLFSPQTSVGRFYTLNTTSGLFATTDPLTTPFIPGAGYLIRMPNNHVDYTATATPLTWTGTFTGIANNGKIRVPLDISGQRYNMVSNPYPSLIDAEALLDDNAAEIDGTIYFWRRRNNAPTVGELTSAYYATYTKAGGVGVEPIATASETSEIPNGLIQVGQGFIVKALEVPLNSALTFNNQMRDSENNDGQFFRAQQVSERNRIWLNVTNSDGAFGQTLVAYMAGADNGVDRTDGKYMNDGTFSLSSYLDESEYIIQGRAPFDPLDVVPMHFKTPTAGNYRIAIDHTDGLFQNSQVIYLRDKFNGIEHDLKASDYAFATEAGNFSDRFEIFYQTPLGIENPIGTPKHIIVYKQNEEIIINAGNDRMSSVKVFDIRGRLLIEKDNINASEMRIGNAVSQQVLILRITMEDQIVVTKKITN